MGFNYSVVSSNNSLTENTEPEQSQAPTKIFFGVGLGIGIAISIFIFVVLRRKIISRRRVTKDSISKDDDEFFSCKTDSIEFELNSTVDSEGYDESADIPRENWSIDAEILETGDFFIPARKGRVKLPTKEDPIEVAIKSFQKAEGVDDFKRFLYEINLIKYIGFHPNVVSQLATCVTNQLDAMIALQHCSRRSLESYLKTHAYNLRQIVEDSSSEDYANIFECPSSVYANVTENCDLKESDLYVWSHQIASGMEFLMRKQVLHGDLRTSNVLLTSNKTAKISNFELSRHLGKAQTYTRTEIFPGPWRNLAIESLQTSLFSTKSDVWAFGVTVWEIFALGETPYEEFKGDNEFIQRLLGGMRLPKPWKSNSFVYQLMSHCWEINPVDRPSFTHLKHHFGFIIKLLNDQKPQAEFQIP